MIWTQAVLPLIVGLVVISWQNVQAEESFRMMSTPDKTTFEAPPLAENFLYTYFACRGKPNGLRLPVAGSCVDYYECQQGVARRLTCKTGMHFSNLGLTCLDSRLSQCKPEQTLASVTCDAPCCKKEDGLYPAEGSCSKFVICVNQQAFQRSCGKFLQFSAENLICDIPERARCSAPIEKDINEKEEKPHTQDGSLKPTMYMVSHRVCHNQPDGHNIAIFGSCNKFYLCVRGVGYLKSCGNLQFNAEKHFCDLRTRMYCPEVEIDDVILDEEEFVQVDTRPMPLPGPRPKPIPLNVDKDGKMWEKKPMIEEEEENVQQQPPHKSQQNNKKPVEDEKETAKPNGKRPRPPTIVEEEEEEEMVQTLPEWGKKPNPKPPVPEKFEKEQLIGKPNRRPQGDDKKSAPKPPVSEPKPVPPHIIPPEKEEETKVLVGNSNSNSNICADQPVGALMATPNDCTTYIWCRWDWFERRSAEVMTCPLGMHFNPKSKYCDWPEKAGCNVNSKNTKTKNKFTDFF